MSAQPSCPTCRQCGGEMQKTKRAESNLAVQVLGLLVFIVGVVLLFFFPIGTIMGLILMLVAARMGYRKVKVWKCRSCGYFFERD